MNMHTCPFAQQSRAEAGHTQADDPARRRRWIWLAVLASVLFVAFLVYKARGPQPPAPTAGAPVVTVIAPAVAPVVASINAVGTIHPRQTLPVGVVGEGGMVSRIRAEAGSMVRKGQVLAEIEHGVQQAQVEQLQASVAEAKANAALAQAELKRAVALVDRGFISRADIDRKTAARDAADAQVRAAEGRLREMRERLARLYIRAPEAGLVLERNVEPGQVVSPASGVLYRLAARGEMELRAEIAEEDMAGLAVGQSATVTPVGATHSYRGRIWLLPPVIDPQTREGVARIALPPAPDIRAGAFATATIDGAETSRPLLPQSAVLADGQGLYVMVVDAKNIVRRVPVTTGVTTPRGVAILSGLSGRERVLKSAGAFFTPGDKVVPRLDATPPASAPASGPTG